MPPGPTGIMVCAMTAQCLADRLRAIVDSLEPAFGLEADDPDLLTLKRILLVKAADLESEAASPRQTTHRS
jgi:hypothetical protein